MIPPRFLASLAGAIILSGAVLAAEEEQGDSSAGLPQDYASDYLVAASTMSQDKNFAIIYPTADDEEFPGGKNKVVSLQPFAILGVLDTEWPYFKNQNHGGLRAEWSEDGAVALVTLEGKWGPRDIFVLEFQAGKLTRATNIRAKAHDLLVPDFRKAKAAPYNDNFKLDFIFEDGDEDSWKLEGAKSVRIEALGTTDPKGAANGKVWEGRVEATWDIAQAKFTSQKVTRVFAGIRKHND